MRKYLISLLCLLSGIYSLAIYIPFSFHQFVQPKIYPWLYDVVIYFPWLILAGYLFQKKVTNELHWSLRIFGIVTCLALIIDGSFTTPKLGFHNYVFAIALFFMSISLRWGVREWESSVRFEALDSASFVLAIIWSFLIRTWQHPDSLLWLFSIKALLIFVLLATLDLLRHFLPRYALTAFSFLFYSVIINQFTLQSLSMRGPLSFMASALMGLSISFFIIQFYQSLASFPKILSGILLVSLTAMVLIIDPIIVKNDWNGQGQLLFSCLSTTLAAILFANFLRDKNTVSFRGYIPFVLGVAALGLFQAIGGFQKNLGYSASEQIIQRAVTLEDSNKYDHDFYEFLHKNANLQGATDINSTDIDFWNNKEAQFKPHIFVFVIDSLRRDSIGVNNLTVDQKTPNLDKFARENLNFVNAFSRYGGTGLSEPSIWAGSLIPHRQYIVPFSPLNALEKMLEGQGYSQFILMDEVLSAILKPNPLRINLNSTSSSHHIRFCNVVKDIETNLREQGSEKPLFFYSQPQDLHISVRPNGSATIPQASYAQEVQRIDHCFGSFVHVLQSQKIYEQSIIVVTSDHGDSLGEEGRFGHAYSLTPEIVRVPLLIHVPQRLKNQYGWNTQKTSFTIDITPTLYKILGIYSDKSHSPLMGSPLNSSQGQSEEYSLISASYGPVFGLLNKTGTELYLADGIQLQESLYNVVENRQVSLDKKQRKNYRKILHKKILEVSDYYRINMRDSK